MKGVEDTADNLQAAIEGEGHEFKEMYPNFLAEAEAEGHNGAVVSFKYAMAIEEIQHPQTERQAEPLHGSPAPPLASWIEWATRERGAPPPFRPMPPRRVVPTNY